MHPDQVDCTLLDATFDQLYNVTEPQIPGRLCHLTKELIGKLLLRLCFNYDVGRGQGE